jgi:NAD(P)-dependent dehydrogenase (short-subunit alcohol dehydrogenase family)
MRLRDKIALVTGGARGIGAGIARCLSEEGAGVVVIDIDAPEAEKLAASLRGPALGLGADVSQEAEIGSAVERAAQELGGIDILVNNAGAGTGREDPSELPLQPGFENHPQAAWDAQLANNLRTTFAACKVSIPQLRARGGGSIVNIASIAALTPSPQLVAYGAAKAGVIHLTRSLALELAPHDIRVNAICPGFLWTRAWEGLAAMMKLSVPEFADAGPRDVFLSVVKRGVPLGREPTPEDIGKLVAFLASDDARNITGEEIKVDGGITLRTGG